MTYNKTLKIQIAEFPHSIIMTKDEFLQAHDKNQHPLIECLADKHPNAVYYKLPKGECGAYELSCNGVRYGKDGDYCSFQHI